MPSATKTVVVGWHGADWKSIHPLVDAGLMPNLGALIERGVIGSVRGIGPAHPAILWTSLVTGRPADQHGVLSSIEPDPLGGSVRPVTSTARRVKALWNIAMQSGLRTHVAGWCVGHPAEPLNGSCVTNHFSIPLARFGDPWPLLPGSIFPESLVAQLGELRMHTGELTGAEILPFIPRLREIDQETDGRVLFVADALARAISNHAVVTWLMEHQPWDLMMAGWEAIERVAYQFMQYEPPRLPLVSEEDCARYGEVVKGMYCFHDMLLGRLVQLAGPDANIVLVSPTGFRVGDERPVNANPRERPGAWLRQYGMLCMAGPNIRRDKLIHGVTTFDITPAILAMLDIPPADDMPGRVPAEVFRKAPEVHRIPSWEDVPGSSGMHLIESADELRASAQNIAELEKLGYADEPSKARQYVMALVDRDRLMNTALVHFSANQYKEARSVFEQLLQLAPSANQVRIWLAYCHFLSAEKQACREILQGVEWDGAAGAMASLMQAQLETEPESIVAHLQTALSLGSEIALVNYVAGALYLQLKRLDDAAQALDRAIEIDPAFQPAHALRARLLTLRGNASEAVDAALKSLEIDFSSALAHFAVGLAMVGSGNDQRALQSFDRSAALSPGLREAGAWAAAIRIREMSRLAAEEQA